MTLDHNGSQLLLLGPLLQPDPVTSNIYIVFSSFLSCGVVDVDVAVCCIRIASFTCLLLLWDSLSTTFTHSKYIRWFSVVVWLCEGGLVGGGV